MLAEEQINSFCLSGPSYWDRPTGTAGVPPASSSVTTQFELKKSLPNWMLGRLERAGRPRSQ
jgi:hypothetical protein